MKWKTGSTRNAKNKEIKYINCLCYRINRLFFTKLLHHSAHKMDGAPSVRACYFIFTFPTQLRLQSYSFPDCFLLKANILSSKPYLGEKENPKTNSQLPQRLKCLVIWIRISIFTTWYSFPVFWFCSSSYARTQHNTSAVAITTHILLHHCFPL